MIPILIPGMFKVIGQFLCRYWKPIAMLMLLLLAYFKGAADENSKLEYRYAVLQKAAAEERAAHSERLRKQEQDDAAFANLLSLNMLEHHDATNKTRDRIIADLRAGSLRLPTLCPTAAPQAAADSSAAPEGQSGGQPAMVGEAITARFADCDDAINERNTAVELMRRDRL